MKKSNALNDILPTETAVVDVKFKEQLKDVTEGYKDSLSTIQLTSYEQIVWFIRPPLLKTELLFSLKYIIRDGR